jgi:hypothetical protein
VLWQFCMKIYIIKTLLAKQEGKYMQLHKEMVLSQRLF